MQSLGGLLGGFSTALGIRVLGADPALISGQMYGGSLSMEGVLLWSTGDIVEMFLDLSCSQRKQETTTNK